MLNQISQAQTALTRLRQYLQKGTLLLNHTRPEGAIAAMARPSLVVSSKPKPGAEAAGKSGPGAKFFKF